jgi:hypothetical protein
MMTTMICKVCSEPKVVTSRSVVLPYICDECQKAEELYNAMAPTPAPLKALRQIVEESDNHACDSATVENTTLLIEDQANQLALAKNEVEALRQVNQYLEAREATLTAQVEAKQNAIDDLLVRNFFKDEKIKLLASDWFELAAEVGKLTHERDVWKKRALFARRQYDRASADRRYYRAKCWDAGIKA